MGVWEIFLTFAAGFVSVERMKRLLISLLTASCALTSMGQEVSEDFEKLSLPPLTLRGTIAHYPYYNGLMGGFYDWELHSGFNASLSAAAIFGLGHNAGSGFANSMAMAYAGRITPKLSYSIGGYTSFLDYASHVMKDAGLTAMLSYRFDEHWEAALFAQKSLIKPQVPRHLYWMDDVGDKIGASVRYSFNPAFSIGLSVWRGSAPR